MKLRILGLFRRPIVAALLSSCAVCPAQTTPPPPPHAPTLTITSRLVVLDVVVTDKQGNLVPGLTKNDFTVLEDNVPQRIRSFETPSEHLLPKDVQINSTADLAKVPNAPVTILVLDELNTQFSDMAFARQALQKYLNAQPARLTQPTTLLVVNNTKFQVLHDYTLDRQALLTALKNHFPQYPWELMQHGKGGPGATERLAMSLGSLEEITQATAGHPGRKNLIWVGVGFPSIDTTESTDKEAAVIQNAVQKVIDDLRDARITLTTIDPTIASAATTLIETPDDLIAAENDNGSDPFAGTVNFQTLAPATGGRVYMGRNDVDAEIGQSILYGNTYYTLTYSPSGAIDPAQPYRSIRIKMNVPGLTATTRNGYYLENTAAPSTPPSAADEKAALKQQLNRLAFDLGAAANSTLAYTGLHVTASRVPGSPETFIANVAAHDLTFAPAPDGSSQAEVTVMAVSYSAQGKILAHTVREMTAREQPDTAAATTAAFRIQATTPPGTARERIVVRDAHTGKMGTADLSGAELR